MFYTFLKEERIHEHQSNSCLSTLCGRKELFQGCCASFYHPLCSVSANLQIGGRIGLFPFLPKSLRHFINPSRTGVFFSPLKKQDILLAEAQKNAEALSRGAQILRISMETSEYASGLKAFELAYPDVLIRHVETPYDDIQFVYDLLCNHQLDVHEGEYTHDIETRGLVFIRLRKPIYAP